MTAGMDFSEWSYKTPIGKLPYYFYMLAPGLNNQWYVYDMVSHSILHNQTDFKYHLRPTQDAVYTYKMTHEDCYQKPDRVEPCLIH